MNTSETIKSQSYVCPWWLIKTFDNPFRKLIQNSGRILGGLVKKGDHCLDLGCGFGYYTLAMAREVGDDGRVTAVDIQPKMLEGTLRRAEKAGLSGRINLHRADVGELKLSGEYDFALSFWMVHEVKERERFINTVYSLLKPGGNYLIVEPRIHVSKKSFDHSMDLAEKAGFKPGPYRKVFFSRARVLLK